MHSSAFAPPRAPSPELNWTRLLEVLQQSRAQAQHGGNVYIPDSSRDLEEGPSEDPLSSAAGDSPSPSRERSPQALLTSTAPQYRHHHSNHYLQEVRQQGYLQQQQQHFRQPESHLQGPSGISEATGSRGLSLLGQLSRRTQAAALASGADAADPEGQFMSVSAAAERHRLSTENAGVSLPALAEWLADLVPYVLLMGWVFIFKHVSTLFVIVFLCGCTFHANSDIRRLIAAQREVRPATCLLQALSVCAFTSSAVLLTLPDTALLRALMLRQTRAASAVDALLLVLLADGVLRLGSLAPKLLVVAWFRSRRPLEGGGEGGGGSYLSGARHKRQQTRVLTAVERGVTLYRTILPGPVWYGYLLHGGGFSPVVASLFCGFYLTLKASFVFTQTKLLALALKTATRQGSLYGTYVGRDASAESGGIGACPVCQDPVNTPVRLDCGHIFCEECILEWLERDRTCPMCRAQVRQAGLPSCSAGTSPLLPQVF